MGVILIGVKLFLSTENGGTLIFNCLNFKGGRGLTDGFREMGGDVIEMGT